MSRYYRKARTILAALPEFPKVRITTAVFAQQDKEFLFGPHRTQKAIRSDDSKANLPAKLPSKISRRDIYDGAIASAMISALRAVDDSNFTGTVNCNCFVLAGDFFKNALFTTICEGDDHRLFETIADYCGRGLAESPQLASAEELETIEYGGYSSLWNASLCNLCSVCEWRNSSTEIADEPSGKFRMHTCEDAFQATWDALTSFLCLTEYNDPERTMPVVLNGQGKPVLVKGIEKLPLTTAQFDVIEALIRAGSHGLNKDQLARNSEHGDAVRILKRVVGIDEEWKSIISLAGKPGGGYRILDLH